MTLRAVTFDYWDTLYVGAVLPERMKLRQSALHRMLADLGHAIEETELATLYHASPPASRARTRYHPATRARGPNEASAPPVSPPTWPVLPEVTVTGPRQASRSGSNASSRLARNPDRKAR